MANRIVFQAHVDRHSSYSLHLLHLCRGLDKLGYETVVRPIRQSGVSDELEVVHGIQPEPLEILLAPLGSAPTPGKTTIRMLSWESTHIPASEVAKLNDCQCLVVPSNFVATVASASGVTVPIIVIPLGVSEYFSYRPMPDLPFTFACAGNPTSGVQRKGLDRIVSLFERAFPQESNVWLYVKAYPSDNRGKAEPRIEMFRDFMSEPEVTAWLADCHCFVNFATGGWESWTHEAMVTGRPVIGCAYGGMADYFNAQNGLVVAHNLVPAGDTWAGKGSWAEPDEDSAIAAMRWAFSHLDECRELGLKAHLATQALTWEHSCKRLAALVEQLTPKSEVLTVESGEEADEFTVAITSFQRPKHLDRAIQSAVVAGADHIVVASMAPDAETQQVIDRWQAKLRRMFTATVLRTDLGCNELWLQAAYHSPTERMILLHDDDFLDPKFGGVYQNTIHPALCRGAGFASWRGRVVWDDGRQREWDYRRSPTAMLDSRELELFVTQKGRLSLSPIVSMFKRSVLIAAIKECEQVLTEPVCHLRPGMLLGTEILAYLRHCSNCPKWFYVDEVLSYYGAHQGSGTVQAEQSGNLSPLIAGYDFARNHFEEWRYAPPDPSGRILLVYTDYEPADLQESARFQCAMDSWRRHFETGKMLEFRITEADLSRNSSDIGDNRPIPYLRDIMEFAMKRAQREDIVFYVNRDACLTTQAADRIITAVQRGRGATIALRRSVDKAGAYESVKGAVPDGGFDGVALTPEWWDRHQREVPDMLIGREAWDAVFHTILEELYTGKLCRKDAVWSEKGKRSDFPSRPFFVDDVIYHIPHDSAWKNHRTTNPGQRHNRSLARTFFRKRWNECLIKGLTEICVCSTCYNQADIIPFFLRHYQTIAEKIVVWDDCSTDGSQELLAANPKVDLRKWPHAHGMNERLFLEHAYAEHPKLDGFEWVFWVDMDEFIYGDIFEALCDAGEQGVEVVRTRGFNMVGNGLPKDDGRQIWEQLQTGVYSPIYSKPVIFKPDAPMRWWYGKHGLLPSCRAKVSQRAMLKLLHYRYLGAKYTASKNRKNYSRVDSVSMAKGLAKTCAPGHTGLHSPKWAEEKKGEAINAVTADIAGFPETDIYVKQPL